MGENGYNITYVLVHCRRYIHVQLDQVNATGPASDFIGKGPFINCITHFDNVDPPPLVRLVTSKPLGP